MPKLQPLIVPWKISPSTPHLGVSTKSFEGVNHGFVTFMASWASEQSCKPGMVHTDKSPSFSKALSAYECTRVLTR